MLYIICEIIKLTGLTEEYNSLLNYALMDHETLTHSG